MATYDSQSTTPQISARSSDRRTDVASTAVDQVQVLKGATGKLAIIAKGAYHPIEFKSSETLSPVIESTKRPDLVARQISDPSAQESTSHRPARPQPDQWTTTENLARPREPIPTPHHIEEHRRGDMSALALMAAAALSLEAVSEHRPLPHLPHEEYERDIAALTMKTDKELAPDRRPPPRVRVSMGGRDSFVISMKQ